MHQQVDTYPSPGGTLDRSYLLTVCMAIQLCFQHYSIISYCMDKLQGMQADNID